ncbi:hypothetical protein CsSME_00014780 [Camellia sinensis var. sinensis]
MVVLCGRGTFEAKDQAVGAETFAKPAMVQKPKLFKTFPPSTSGKVRAEMVVVMKPIEEVFEAKTEPRFKPKKGSVIPAKRRLVKTMMFNCIVESIASLFCFRSHNNGSCPEIVLPINTSNSMIDKKTKKEPFHTPEFLYTDLKKF